MGHTLPTRVTFWNLTFNFVSYCFIFRSTWCFTLNCESWAVYIQNAVGMTVRTWQMGCKSRWIYIEREVITISSSLVRIRIISFANGPLKTFWFPSHFLFSQLPVSAFEESSSLGAVPFPCSQAVWSHCSAWLPSGTHSIRLGFREEGENWAEICICVRRLWKHIVPLTACQIMINGSNCVPFF